MSKATDPLDATDGESTEGASLALPTTATLIAALLIGLLFALPTFPPVSAGQQAGRIAESRMIQLALRFVSFLDQAGKATAPRDLVDEMLERANSIFLPCGIRFRVEDYLPVRPAERGLPFNLSSMAHLDPVRREFDVPDKLVVIDTGNWEHQTMGKPNAWTAMPGSSPSGAVLEAAVHHTPEIIAHELGHYLSLGHEGDQANLMNPIIYRTSTVLSDTQCSQARKSALTSRAKAIRTEETVDSLPLDHLSPLGAIWPAPADVSSAASGGNTV